MSSKSRESPSPKDVSRGESSSRYTEKYGARPIFLSTDKLLSAEYHESLTPPHSAPLTSSVSWQNISSPAATLASSPLSASISTTRPSLTKQSRKYQKSLWKMKNQISPELLLEDDEVNDTEDYFPNKEELRNDFPEDSSLGSFPVSDSVSTSYDSLDKYGHNNDNVQESAQKNHFFGTKKKQNSSLNHLLNFSLPERPKVVEEFRRRKRIPLPSFNKEQFVCANFRFLVKQGVDYTEIYKAPDSIIPWQDVEQVLVTTTKRLSCPICLQRPIAARVTRCGHVYCWCCLLRFLAFDDQRWKPCPICYQPVAVDDLRGVRFVNVKDVEIGETISLQLMERRKGTVTVYPRSMTTFYVSKDHIRSESDEIAAKFGRLVLVSSDRLLQSLFHDKEELTGALENAQLANENETMIFIESALDETNSKITKLSGEMLTNVPQPLSDTSETWSDSSNGNRRPQSISDKSLSVMSPEVLSPQPFSTENYYYFYQAEDGQQIFLHSLNVKMLLAQFKSPNNLPHSLSGKVLGYTEIVQDEDARRKNRYLAHLPLLCELAFVELDLKDVVSSDILLEFKDEIQQRTKERTHYLVPPKLSSMDYSYSTADDINDLLARHASIHQFYSETKDGKEDAEKNLNNNNDESLSKNLTVQSDETMGSYAQIARSVSVFPRASSSATQYDVSYRSASTSSNSRSVSADVHSSASKTTSQPLRSRSKPKEILFTSGDLASHSLRGKAFSKSKK